MQPAEASAQRVETPPCLVGSQLRLVHDGPDLDLAFVELGCD
jgi:hypothetical protein